MPLGLQGISLRIRVTINRNALCLHLDGLPFPLGGNDGPLSADGSPSGDALQLLLVHGFKIHHHL